MHDFDIALIGCGNMGAALAAGYLGKYPDSRLLVVDPDVERASAVTRSEDSRGG